MQPNRPVHALGEALKAAVAILRAADVPFVLGGSLACWARGGPEPWNDLDLMLKPVDAERAFDVLSAAGMRTERPPEEWLLKAWCGEVLIDLIFAPAGLEMTDEVLARAEDISVLAVSTPVMRVDDVLATKLNAMNEHSLDYEAVLGIARSLREQIDWERLWAQTAGSPFARAFFALAEGLGIAPARPGGGRAGGAQSNVRVIAG